MRVSHFSWSVFVLALSVGSLLGVSGCQSAGGSGSAIAGKAGSQGLGADGPLAAGPTVLVISGLSCPLCASNVDRSLARIPGVAVVGTDLSNGEVTLQLSGQSRPSRAALAKAVEESGFTLVSIRSGGGV